MSNVSLSVASLETINTVLQPFYARLPGGQGNVTINDPFRDVVNTVVQPVSNYRSTILVKRLGQWKQNEKGWANRGIFG